MQTEIQSGAILTEAQVLKLLKDGQGELTQKQYAKKMKVGQAYLSDVYAGRRFLGTKMLKFLKLERVFRRK